METIRIKANNKKGYEECVNCGIVDFNYVSSKTRRGRVQNGGVISPTITCENVPYRIKKGGNDLENEKKYAIRKLTPNECWRLMNFTDEDFKAAESVNSNTQLYKQAGNSICKNVLVAIFGQMIEGKENVYKEIKLENPKSSIR